MSPVGQFLVYVFVGAALIPVFLFVAVIVGEMVGDVVKVMRG